MGGKHKQAQRTKNNARPSSSGRSAELLGSSVSPFTGFSTLKDMSGPAFSKVPFAPASGEDTDPNLDTNFQLVLKKMNKKDAVTKLKALQEFTELVKTSQPEAVKAVLSYWPRLYNVLAVDAEHRVREAAHNAHREVVLKAKRNLAPYLKQLVGPWFTSQYDTYPPAASAAIKSFEDAFPGSKMREAIAFCQEEILAYICDNITVQTAQTLNFSKTLSPEEAEAKYERVLISSLQGYSLYLEKLTKEQLEAAKEINVKMIKNSRFWKPSKAKIPLIRAAWFRCITALCKNAPFFLEEETKQVTAAVFSNLDETEPVVLPVTWEAVLYTVSNIDNWWSSVNFEKLVLPKLWKILREGGQGSAVTVYQNILPLISRLPENLASETLYNNLFENIIAGMKKKSVLQSKSELNAITSCFAECFRFIIKENVSNRDLCRHLIITQLMPIIDWSCSEESICTKTLFTEVSLLLQYWRRNCDSEPCLKECLECFWKNIEEMFCKMLEKCSSKTDKELNSMVEKQTEFLFCLKKNSARKHKVKFASDDSQSGSGEDTSETMSESPAELNKVVFKVCTIYLKCVADQKRWILLDSLCRLILEFDSRELFIYMTEQFLKSPELIKLHESVFSKLLVHSSTCATAVELTFTLYQYLQEKDKQIILKSLGDQEDSLCGGIAKAFSHPFYLESTIQDWLRSSRVSEMLVKIAESMLTGELTAERTLLLKKALNEEDDEELIINKEACKKITGVFCRPLERPSAYPLTVDTCASFATELCTAIYTDKSLLSYGDSLILGLFSLCCNSKYDPDTISKDTLWEVSTSWQDALGLLAVNNVPELENLLEKLVAILHRQLLSESRDVDRLSGVAFDLIKTVWTDKSSEGMDFIIGKVFHQPDIIKQTAEFLKEICMCADLLKGNLTWRLTKALEASYEVHHDVTKYALWFSFTMKVLTLLFAGKMKQETGEEDEDEDEDDEDGSILRLSTTATDDVIFDVFYSFTLFKLFGENYKVTEQFSEIGNELDALMSDYRNFAAYVVPEEAAVRVQDRAILAIEDALWARVTFDIRCDLLKQSPSFALHELILAHRTGFKDLALIFSEHLVPEDVPKDAVEGVELMAATRALLLRDGWDERLNTVFKKIASQGAPAKDQAALWVETARMAAATLKYRSEQLTQPQRDLVSLSLACWLETAPPDGIVLSAVADLFASFRSWSGSADYEEFFSKQLDNKLAEQVGNQVKKGGPALPVLLHVLRPAIELVEPSTLYPSLKDAVDMLRGKNGSLQVWGHFLLRRAVPQLPSDSQLESAMNSILKEYRLCESISPPLPHSPAYINAQGYLLLWDALLDAPSASECRPWLRTHFDVLLALTLRFMPPPALRPPGITDLFMAPPPLLPSDPQTTPRLQHVGCWLFRRALAQLPALARTCWTESEPRHALAIEQAAAAYVSPLLCAQELQDVLDRDRANGSAMKVRVFPSAREVAAVYTLDEARTELIVHLPPNYPLGQVQVTCDKQIGGSAQWRNTVMQLTVFLSHQNGSIWDGLSLWKNNLDKKFDGVEECYICFSVLHNLTYQLPKLSCQTCKKKFHSSCLYKWFSTSNKSTCPICRNLF